MEEESGKSALLKRLVIEEADDPPSQASFFTSPWVIAPLFLVIGLAVGVGVLAPKFGLSKDGSEARIAGASSVAQKDSQTIQSKSSVQTNEETELRGAILNASGYVTPRLMATVSSELMGLIESVDVEEGMTVTKGQVLATLDDTVAQVNWSLSKAQLDSQRARQSSLESEYQEALRVWHRQQGLEKQGLTSDAALTAAQSRVESLKASLASVTADVRVAELQVQRQQELLNDHVIRAPFSGVVTVKNAQPGEIVAPSSAGGGFTRTGICTIVDMASLEIEVDVNESFIGRVFEGQKVVANLDAYPQWDIPASVVAVIPTANRSKATVQVRIAILEQDARVLPEMGVKVAFYAEDEK